MKNFIVIHLESDEFRVNVTSLRHGESWATVFVDEAISIHIDLNDVAAARAMSKALTQAADELDATALDAGTAQKSGVVA